MSDKPQIKLKNKNEVDVQKEVNVLVERNSTSTSTNNYIRTAKLIDVLDIDGDGISLDLWNNISLDWVMFRDILERYMVTNFKWEIKDKDFYRPEEFVKKLEQLLFRHGNVAIVKTPDGNVYPANFTYVKDDCDYYGVPKKITLITDNKFNGKIIYEKNFVIMYNTSSRKGTLDLSLELMRQTVIALKDVYNNRLMSGVKFGVGISQDDDMYIDLYNAFRSKDPIVPLGNSKLLNSEVHDMSQEDRAEEKIRTFEFLMSLWLKVLGLKTNPEKLERQTELEVARNDEFDGNLMLDMYNNRQSKTEELKDKLGIDMTLPMTQEIKGEDEDKDEVNGEENKKKGLLGRLRKGKDNGNDTEE